jgi:hypothetical protein
MSRPVTDHVRKAELPHDSLEEDLNADHAALIEPTLPLMVASAAK